MTSTFDPAATPAARAAPRTRLAGRSSSVYLVLLAWVVLWKLEVPWVGEAGERIVKLVPFVATGDAGASTPFEVVANLALFVPFGVYLGLLAPSWPWWKVAGTVAAVSLALEVAQYVLAVGSSDLTDVVVNTAGGVVGLGLVALARRRFGARDRHGPDAGLHDRDRARRARELRSSSSRRCATRRPRTSGATRRAPRRAGRPEHRAARTAGERAGQLFQCGAGCPNTGGLCHGGTTQGRKTGGATNVNATEVVERPAGVVTATRTAPAACFGTTTASSVLLRTVTLLVVTVPNETVVRPATKFLPVSTVSVPPVVRPTFGTARSTTGSLPVVGAAVTVWVACADEAPKVPSPANVAVTVCDPAASVDVLSVAAAPTSGTETGAPPSTTNDTAPVGVDRRLVTVAVNAAAAPAGVGPRRACERQASSRPSRRCRWPVRSDLALRA